MAYRVKGNAAEEAELLRQKCIQRASRWNGKLLSVDVKNIDDLLLLACDKGHQFNKSARNLLYKDSWCPQCSSRGKLGVAEATQILEKLDYQLVSGFENQNSIVNVRCGSCKRELEGKFSSFKLLKRQCACRRNSKRFLHNVERLNEVCESRGGVLLSQAPQAINNQFKFRCALGHEWNTTGTSVLSSGTWCAMCSGNAQRDISELQNIVQERQGSLLTKVYLGVDGKYDFECSLGHQFSNSFKKVEKGQWCPICSRGSKSEEIARTTLEQLFGVKFSRRRPTWLRNSRGFQMELDGFNEDLKLAFEYQGYQHYKADHWGTDLEQRIKDDNLKQVICAAKGVTLLQITHDMEYHSFPREIKKQLDMAGFDTHQVNFEMEIDLSKAYIREDRLEELKELMKSKNIEVISNAWLGVHEKYKMHCNVCGSDWEAKGNAFFNRRGAAGCDYCNRRTPANKKEISSLVKFAEEHGGKVLSTEYVRRNYTYKWICQKGHHFEANFNAMKWNNTFCPECENRQTKVKLGQQEAEKLFREHNFELLEPFTIRSRYLSARCIECGFTSNQMLDNLTAGKRNCKGCKIKIQSSEGIEHLRKANAIPLEDFVSNTTKWRSRCMKCNREIFPRVSDLKRGQGACRECGWDKTRVPK